MRHFVILACTALSLLLSAGVGTAGALQGEGDFEFYIDVASLPGSGQNTLEIFHIAIPTKEIEYKEEDGRYQAAIRFRLTLKDEEIDDVVYKKTFEVKDTKSSLPVATDLSGFLYVVDSCLVSPGRYRLELRLEDRQRRKKTLIGLFKKKYLASELKDAYIIAPDFSGKQLAISEPVFVWSRTADGGIVPNPMRIYGLKNDTLTMFVDARTLLPETDSLDLRFSVIDDKGEVLASEDVSGAFRNGRAKVFGAFDVNTFPAGSYRVFAEVVGSGTGYYSVQSEFSVAWELVNWQKPRRDILVEARVLLTDNEYEEFSAMSLGDQERILNGYWKENDPTPQTAVNETYEEFLRRLRFAERYYGGFTRGALSDRGLIYIRYGPPDDIIQQRVPTNRSDLGEALDKLENDYNIVVHSIGDRSDISPLKGSDTRPKILYDKPQAVRGIEGDDTGAYELWIYNQSGNPIFERDKFMTMKMGHRFLFIDLDGYGEYEMVGTSEDYSSSYSE